MASNWQGLDPTSVVSVYSTGYGRAADAVPGIQREDLLDLITNIDPWDNIVFAMLPKRRARSTTHEWPVDTLPTVSRSGVPDGSDFSASGMQAPYRLKNYTQIFRWDVQVTGTEQEVDNAGMTDKLAYQVLNGTHAMAKAAEQRIFDIGTTGTTWQFVADINTNFTNMAGFGTAACPGYGGPPGNAAQTSGQTTARRMTPLYELIAQAFPASNPWISTIVDAGNVALAAARVDDVCQAMFANGLSPETLVLNQQTKRNLAADVYSTNTTINTRFIQATEKRVIRGVDIYEGELTTLSVIPNRSIPVPASGTNGYGMAWVLQKDKLGIAFLRPIKATPLARTGDADKTMLLGEFTLELLHPVGAGGVARCL